MNLGAARSRAQAGRGVGNRAGRLRNDRGGALSYGVCGRDPEGVGLAVCEARDRLGCAGARAVSKWNPFGAVAGIPYYIIVDRGASRAGRSIPCKGDLGVACRRAQAGRRAWSRVYDCLEGGLRAVVCGYGGPCLSQWLGYFCLILAGCDDYLVGLFSQVMRGRIQGMSDLCNSTRVWPD